MEEKIFDGLGEFKEKSEVLLEMTNKRSYRGLSISEVHCIEKIEKLELPNVTKISEALKMTRGGVTKLTGKLTEKGYIERYSITGNKKEVHFRLTEEGREVYEKHEILHEEVRKREVSFFSESFSRTEQRVIVEFLRRLNDYTDGLIEELED